MFDLLKKLFMLRKHRVDIILLDNTKPGKGSSYNILPNRLIVLLVSVIVFLSIFFSIVFSTTPLGQMFNKPDDEAIREQIRGISDRIVSLQDSLTIRDQQLNEMKTVIKLSMDTTMQTDDRLMSLLEAHHLETNTNAPSFDDDFSFTSTNKSGVFNLGIFEKLPDFPSHFPVQGTLTRKYDPNQGHYGIDIATKKNEIIYSVADGTVINTSWTINDGYLISVQHTGGILSQLKHCSSLTKKTGDVVLKGDIIGMTGNAGVLSSGPHLHFEIWKDGIPQDPELYLIR